LRSKTSNVALPESSTLPRIGGSLMQKSKKAPNLKMLTRSTMFMQTILEERESRIKNQLKTPTANNVDLDKSIRMQNLEHIDSTNDSDRLKKEYFRVVSAVF